MNIKDFASKYSPLIKVVLIASMAMYVAFPDPVPGPIDDLIVLIVGLAFSSKLPGGKSLFKKDSSD